MDGWKILGGVLGVFTTFTSITTAIVTLNVRITTVEKDVKQNTEMLNEQRDYLKRAYPNFPYGGGSSYNNSEPSKRQEK